MSRSYNSSPPCTYMVYSGTALPKCNLSVRGITWVKEHCNVQLGDQELAATRNA
jgi:hypothetical protein